MGELRNGVAVDVDTVIRAERVLRQALENGNPPDSVVFLEDCHPEHPEAMRNSELFALAYGPAASDTEVDDAE